MEIGGLRLSTSRLIGEKQGHGKASLSPAAVAPLSAFLLVSAVGIFLSLVGVPGWLCSGLLLAVVTVASWRLLIQRHSFARVATFAAGFSLAAFTAAYLVARIADPEAVSASGEPIGSVGDAGFASLSIGLTGGTIGVDLAGAGRVVAFVQILLTLGLITAAAGWLWNRALGRMERAAEQRGPRGSEGGW